VNKLLNRIMNKAMTTFVVSGVSIDDEGRLCLPDGLSPDRVQRFIGICAGRDYDSPKAAMHALFALSGVNASLIALLNRIIHDNGDVDLAACAHHWRPLAAALPGFKEIPNHFRDFLIHDLALAKPSSSTLQQAVESARKMAATQLHCKADWDEILDRPDGVAELARPWRESLSS
jgi:hypothetical protein